MVQDTNKIMAHIETERERLGDNIKEFESRVKSAADPRSWYDRNPALILGVAAAGGLLLALMTAGSDDGNSEYRPSAEVGVGNPRFRSSHLDAIKSTLDITLGALVGVGASKLQDLISSAVPGFKQHYEIASRRQTGTFEQTGRARPAY